MVARLGLQAFSAGTAFRIRLITAEPFPTIQSCLYISTTINGVKTALTFVCLQISYDAIIALLSLYFSWTSKNHAMDMFFSSASHCALGTDQSVL